MCIRDRRKPVTQAQVTVTQFFDRVLAADRLTVVGEVGYNHLSGCLLYTSEPRPAATAGRRPAAWGFRPSS